MDTLIRDTLLRLYAAHGLGPAARRDLDAFVEMMIDSRLQYTQEGDIGPAADHPADQPEPASKAPFEDLGLLGIGGMGEVRRVRETALDRVVAMKILRAGVDPIWFEREARLTASLDHPGVLPLFTLGRMADGRPYFTLREAVGQTLREVLDEPQGRTQRRLLDALRRVAETVASAHARGVVHRDLKPENILLSAFGAVWVLDWGIAGPAGEVLDSVTGSPRYMSPEQVRREALGTATDVWALGALLYEILDGHPAFSGDANTALAAILRGPPPPLGLPIDPGLASIAARAMAMNPQDRYVDAGAFAESLGAWLDGAAARQEALETLARAVALFDGARQRRLTVAALEAEATRRLVGLPTWAPPEQKEEAWGLEQRARDEQLAAIIDEEQATGIAQLALQRCPDLREAHMLLAAHYRARLVEAEANGDPVATRLEARLQAHDTGEQTRWLRGEGALTLLTDPPGATVRIARITESGRRRIPGPFQPFGTTPLIEVPLARGSWLLELSAPGRHPVLYPVMIDRSALWDGRPSSGAEPWPVWLPPQGELAPDDVYVPAGWCTLGRDPRAINARPAERVWIDGFVVRRFTATNTDYLEFVNHLQEQEGHAAAMAAVPVGRHQEAGVAGELLYNFEEGRWRLDVRLTDGTPWHEDWPVLLITFAQAASYAAYRKRRTGIPWRLLTDDEFEKAARGVDGRFYPWGDGFDQSFSCIHGSSDGPLCPRPVYDFPIDESIYGVRGLAGGCRTWVGAVDERGRARSRGSYWNAAGHTSRSASRFYCYATDRSLVIGVRLARSAGPQWR